GYSPAFARRPGQHRPAPARPCGTAGPAAQGHAGARRDGGCAGRRLRASGRHDADPAAQGRHAGDPGPGPAGLRTGPRQRRRFLPVGLRRAAKAGRAARRQPVLRLDPGRRRDAGAAHRRAWRNPLSGRYAAPAMSEPSETYSLSRPLPAEVLVGGNTVWSRYHRYPVFSGAWLRGRSLLFGIIIAAFSLVVSFGTAVTVRDWGIGAL